MEMELGVSQRWGYPDTIAVRSKNVSSKTVFVRVHAGPENLGNKVAPQNAAVAAGLSALTEL